MQPCASMIENYKTSNGLQTEYLKIYFLVLQVTYFIQCSQMKSVRNTLKSLHHYVQALATRFDTGNEQSLMLTSNPVENLYWMHKDHMGILAYLLTVIHTVQTGCFDKAQKLMEKALFNLEKLRLKEQTMHSTFSLYSSTTYITNKLNIMIVENQIRCSIAMGDKCQAVKQIGDAFLLCERDVKLFKSYSPQLHCLLGVYALATNCTDAAISQFNLSLKSTGDQDLWLYCLMNLALCHLPHMAVSATSKAQLLSILENITPEKIQTHSICLNSFSNYFKALKFFLNNNHLQAQ
jgi:MAternally-affected-uncoordination protein